MEYLYRNIRQHVFFNDKCQNRRKQIIHKNLSQCFNQNKTFGIDKRKINIKEIFTVQKQLILVALHIKFMHPQFDQAKSCLTLSQHIHFESDSSINEQFNPIPSTLPFEERVNLIKSVGKEIIGSDQKIKEKLLTKQFPKAYDGFEPSGRMHIAQGLLKAVNVNKMVDAGCVFIFWIADYFAMLNGKFDGDLEKIKIVGKYFIEVWKAAGMKLHNVKFLWASQEINKRPNQYWMTVMDIACKNSIARVQKCATIMGKKQDDSLKVSQLFYPCMQAADIFFLNIDFCQLGIDQRKVNMLALEYCKREDDRPVIVSHGMISGLREGQQKMAKGIPDSAIFMQDSAKDVQTKIKKAFCPQKTIEGNPILDYCENIIFSMMDSLTIKRKPQNGGDIVYHTFKELGSDFSEGKLHPADLKPAVARAINELIEPVRQHFETNPEAKALMSKIKSFKKNEELGPKQ